MKTSRMLPALALAGFFSGQTTAQVAPAAADDDAAYSLGGVNTNAGPSLSGANVSASASGYNLRVASGSRGADPVILTSPAPDRGAPIKFDNGVFVYPSAFLGLGRNDNVLGTQTNKTASSITNLQPEVVAVLKTGGDRYSASYSGNYGVYSNSRDDNFAHHDVQVAGDNYFSARSRLSWLVGYQAESDPRGSTDRPISTEPDKWHAPVVRGRFGYGAKEATGRIELDAQRMSKRYDNNRSFTQDYDIDMTELAGRFFYRVAPSTSLLAEVRNNQIDYVRATGPHSTEQRYFVGATWEATAATTGILKFGSLRKDFDDATRKDFSGFSWEATVRWQPSRMSVVDIESSRSTADPSGFGNFVVNAGLDVYWQHKWTSYVTSKILLSTLESKFDGTTRTDDTRNYGFALSYDVLRWLSIGVDYRHTDRSSTDASFDFKRNVVMATLEATL